MRAPEACLRNGAVSYLRPSFVCLTVNWTFKDDHRAGSAEGREPFGPFGRFQKHGRRIPSVSSQRPSDAVRRTSGWRAPPAGEAVDVSAAPKSLLQPEFGRRKTAEALRIPRGDARIAAVAGGHVEPRHRTHAVFIQVSPSSPLPRYHRARRARPDEPRDGSRDQNLPPGPMVGPTSKQATASVRKAIGIHRLEDYGRWEK